MSFHPHLHCIVPSGGIDGSGNWKESKKSGSFLLPIAVMRERFKNLYLQLLQDYWIDNQLNMEHTDLQKYKDVVCFRKLLVELKRKKWVVYCEPPMLGVKQVIDYLGRYVHRVALANYRIVAVANDKVTFEYKNYAAAEAGKPAPVCQLTVDAEEFVRRFAQHILPASFQKVRYYGFYASAAKKKL